MERDEAVEGGRQTATTTKRLEFGLPAAVAGTETVGAVSENAAQCAAAIASIDRRTSVANQAAVK